MKESTDLYICADCGKHHPKCHAHRRKLRDENGKKIPCNRSPMKDDPNHKCYLHGGNALKGTNHPSYQGKGFSKYLPTDIAKRLNELNESRNKGEFLTLKYQIELVEVRLSQLAQKLGSGDSQKSWRDVKQARTKLDSAIKSGNADETLEAMKALNRAIAEGEKESRSWEELFTVQRHYEKLLSSERKKMIEDKYMLSVDEVMMLLAMIGVAIKEKIPDKTQRRELAIEVQQIAQRSGFSE